MTQFHQSQVSLSDTPYYHCISRCVRRAYLCCEDKYTENIQLITFPTYSSYALII